MKKCFLFLALLFLTTSSFSQITLEYQDIENLFHAGNVWSNFVKEGGPYNMDIGVTSPGSWKMPSLVYDTLMITMVAPASTPYSSNFPGATHVHRMTGTYMQYSFEGYGYFKLDQTGLYEIGNAQHIFGTGIDTVMYNIEPAPRLGVKLPLTFGMSYRLSYDSTAGQFGVYNVEEQTDYVDRHGEIFLNGAWLPCLRVTTVTDHRVYVNGSPTTSWKSREYSWFTKSNAYATADADTSTLLTGQVPMTALEFTYVSGTSGIREVSSSPTTFTLDQNYPNPFNPATTISFSLEKEGFVKLAVYNTIGEKVADLVNQNLKAGSYKTDFNAAGLSSGIYMYKLESDNYSSVKKMILLK